MKQDAFDTLLRSMGLVDFAFRNKAWANAEVRAKFSSAFQMKNDLDAWGLSHYEMDGFSAAFDKEQTKVKDAEMEVKIMVKAMYEATRVEVKI